MKRVTAVLVLLMSGALCAVAAPGAQAVDSCPNAAYRDGLGANLPDCRAWEQVTPQNKHGQRSDGRAGYATADGGRLIFPALPILSDVQDDQRFSGSLFSSVRGGSAWTTAGLEPVNDTLPNGSLGGSASRNISDDRSKALAVSLRKLTPDAVAGASNIYARDTTDRSYRLLASLPGSAYYESYFPNDGVVIPGDPDFSHVALSSRLPLAPDAPSGDSVYLAGEGRATLISRGVDGQPLSNALPASQRPVSADARRVLFSAPISDVNTSPVLYQRVDGTSTVLISRSQRAGQQPPVPAIYRDTPFASADGTEVTFANGQSDQPLTDDGPGPLYRWRASGNELESVFAGVPTPWSANVDIFSFSLLRVSEDGRYVWFSYRDQDAAGVPFGRLAVLDTQAKRISIKATFSGANLEYTVTTGVGVLRFSPDGTKLVAGTPANLTGYDQSGPACAAEGGRCVEAFAFDAQQDVADPICISCGGQGTASAGGLNLAPAITSALPVPEVVANDGRATFGTAQHLVGADLNALVDVYLYTPGRGASLISSGSGTAPASPVAISASGNDVYFRTADPLVAQDDDADSDTYDARVGGGLAAQQIAPVTGSTCPLGSCPGNRTPAPAASSPGTAAFQASPRPPKFDVAPTTRAARRSAARTGRLDLAVTVGAAGRLSARASARVGRRSVAVARSSLSARKAGRFKVTLKLSRAARAVLAREHTLTVAVAVSYSRAAKPARQTVELAAPRTRSSAKGGAR